MLIIAKAAKKQFKNSAKKREQTFAKNLMAAAKKCKQFLTKLKEIRGDAVFLETEFREHTLWVIPKNPRAKDKPIE